MNASMNSNQSRVYALSGQFGYVSNSYTTAPLSAFAWVLDPACGATKTPPEAVTTATSWKLPALWHAEISFRAYCRGYFIDGVALTAALAAINRLDYRENPPLRLFTDAEIYALVARLNDYAMTSAPKAQSLIAPFLTKLAELRALLDGGFSAAEASSITDFYTKAATVAKIDAAMTAAARAIHAKAKKIYADNVYVPYEGGA